MSKFKICLLTFVVLSILGCSTTGNLYKNKDFTLTHDTVMSVEISYDPVGVASRIEGQLLGMGINLVPYDIAKTRAESDININDSNISISSGTTTYVPASVVLRVQYSYSQTAFGHP